MKEDLDPEKIEREVLEKFARNLSEMKSLLIDTEERILVETWAFFTWGGLLFAGTAGHFLLYRYYGFTISDLLLKLWLPLLIIAIFLESIAWFRKMINDSLPLFNRIAVKLWMSISGATIVFIFVIYLMVQSNNVDYIPVTMQLLMAVVMLYYAQISNYHIYISAFFLILTGMIIYLLGLVSEIQMVIVGITTGCAFIYGGVSTMRVEKKKQ